MNATNKFPTSADGRNPYEFNAARHCRRVILQRAAIPLHSDACVSARRPHVCARICAYVRTGARALSSACTRANSHRVARTHPRIHTRTHAHNADNRTCAPAIYKLYARCNRSYKQFNYVYASEITRLSMSGITTWRPDRSLGYRVIARSDNKIGYLSRTRARTCATRWKY